MTVVLVLEMDWVRKKDFLFGREGKGPLANNYEHVLLKELQFVNNLESREVGRGFLRQREDWGGSFDGFLEKPGGADSRPCSENSTCGKQVGIRGGERERFNCSMLDHCKTWLCQQANGQIRRFIKQGVHYWCHLCCLCP